MFTDNAVVLVDSDSIYFRMACVTKKQKDIRVGIDNTMREIKQNCGSDKLLVAIKGRGNFRKEMYPLYKGTRREIEPSVKEALNYGHKYMVEKYQAVEADYMEADDLVAVPAALADSKGGPVYLDWYWYHTATNSNSNYHHHHQ